MQLISLNRRQSILWGLASLGIISTGVGTIYSFRRNLYCDVLVIGSGAAGLSAASAAIDRGLKVIICEKLPKIGGSTLISGGYFTFPDSSSLRSIGLDDNNDLYLKHIRQTGHGQGDEKVIAKLASEAINSFKWLQQHGVQFTSIVRTSLGGIWPRAHKPMLPLGTGYISALSEYLLSKGTPILTNLKCERLIGQEKTGIEGAEFIDSEYRRTKIFARRGVIICSGGFGQNSALISNWAPEYAGLPCDCAEGSTGELLLAAKDVGADLINLNSIECVAGNIPQQTINSRLGSNVNRFILVNKYGDRFVNENAPRLEVQKALLKEPRGTTWVITDSVAIELSDEPNRKTAWRSYNAEETFKAKNIEELANLTKLPVNNLRNSINNFRPSRTVLNESTPPSFLPPLWASKVGLQIHQTLGGLAIDEEGCVLNVHGDPIVGLRAAGEVTGSVHGVSRLGGNGIVDAVTFGRIAGTYI